MKIDEMLVLKEVDNFADQVAAFIESHGVAVNGKNFQTILNALKKLQLKQEGKNYLILDENKEYVSVETDKNGYILLYNNMDTIAEKNKIPQDINRGYYKIKNNKIVLDEKRKRMLWGD